MARLYFGRAITFRDFKLDLCSMDLMEEIFTGEEWSKYLPVQEYPSLKLETDQSQTSSLHSCDDNELSVTANLDHGSRPKSYSGSGHSCENIAKQQNVIEGHKDDPGVESNIYIYAVPPEEVANPPETRTNPSCSQDESGDIYDYVEYMVPMPLNWKNSKPIPFLDFSVIKVRNK